MVHQSLAFSNAINNQYLIVWSGDESTEYEFEIWGQRFTSIFHETFEDVLPSYWAYEWIYRLYFAGITSGCGTYPLMYCPEQSVTRAQMAIFLERGMRGSGYTPPAASGTIFGDIPSGAFASAWIEQLYIDGIT